jgi:hypothetical protein
MSTSTTKTNEKASNPTMAKIFSSRGAVVLGGLVFCGGLAADVNPNTRVGPYLAGAGAIIALAGVALFIRQSEKREESLRSMMRREPDEG